jgi:RecG-like helicase/REP element-mobilizing transposase RayT
MPTPADTPLNQLPGLESRFVKLLEKEGLATAQEVLAWFPFRHEDRRQQDNQGFAPGPVPVCHHVIVTKASTRYFGGRGRGAFEAQVQPAGGSILGDLLTLRWWNMPFMSRTIVEGMELFIHGRIKDFKGRLSIDHPEYEILKEGEDATESLHTGRITPVYRLRGGVTQKALRTAVWSALQHCSGELAGDLLPAPSPKGEFAGWSASRALRALHFPADQAELEQARRYLALEEFYTYQLRVVHRRRSALDAGGQVHDCPGELAGQLRAELPFELTDAQQRCLDEILRDMRTSAPMNRLLHGDVGSGKTIVAFFAILQAIESGAQAALMAPTQILAEQHYENARKWLTPLGVEVALLTGSRKENRSARVPRAASGVPLDTLRRKPHTVTRVEYLEAESAHPQTHSDAVEVPDATLVSAGADSFQRDAEKSTRDACAPGAQDVRYSKRRLPHFERPWGKYFITCSTAGRKTIPTLARQVVLDAARHFDGDRYHLYAACVMPDHLHLLIEPKIASHQANGTPVFHTLTRILHSLKSFSAHELTKQGLVTAPVWEKESFDRLMRSEQELQEVFGYIISNAREAGLVTHSDDYPFLWTPECEFPRSARVPRAAADDPSDALRRQPHTVTRVEDLEAESAHPQTHSDADEVPDPTPVSAGADSFQRDAEKSTRDACAPGGGPQLLIGTHALLHERDLMPNLGLVVIDEQHKFGVAQRARLIQKGRTPDVLVMTATPIPRTLTLTVYGDLDVSTIDERPKERGKIITKVRSASKHKEAADFLHAQLEEGRQAYLVYPLIEESEKLDAAAAKKGHTEWQKRLPHFSVGLLHGRMNPLEKEQVMRDFRALKHEALVATTVIEVGVDVPNATVMYLHNAERYGLAQIHQLRGRVGRGSHTSYCVLFVADDDEDARQRLAILEETSDGFKIAEEDLKRRGPGDMLGRAQSGQGSLRFPELLADTRLVGIARKLAERTLDQDPHFMDPRFAGIRGTLLETELPQAMMQ